MHPTIGHLTDYILLLCVKKLLRNVGEKFGLEIDFVKKSSDSDLLLIAGGSFIGWNETLCKVSKPIAVFGSGTCFTDAITPPWKKLLKRSFITGVRGFRTQNMLTQAGVETEVIGDPIFSLEPPQTEMVKGLVFGDVRRDCTEPALSFFREAYNFLRAKGWSVILYPVAGDRHEFFDFEVYPRNQPPRISYVGEIVNAIAKSELIVAQRMHPTLIGLLCGRKAIGFDSQWKKLEDALSTLDYPYYFKDPEASDPSLDEFQNKYYRLLNDDKIMTKICEKITYYKTVQREFLNRLFEEYLRLYS